MQRAPSLIFVIVNRSDDSLLLGTGPLGARKVEIKLAQGFLFAHHAASLVLRCILRTIEGLFHALVQAALVLERFGLLLQNGYSQRG